MSQRAPRRTQRSPQEPNSGRAERRSEAPQGIKVKRQPSGFDSFSLRHELVQAIDEMGYTEPRPIQVKGVPPAMQGRDVLGLAQTGTGKTAAFVLPILQRLLVDRRPGLRVLVVTPTRELSMQVHAEFERLGQFTPLTATAIFGGVPVARQIRALKARPDIVVACPGRLLDLLNQRALSLAEVEVLVLDEADHMFDMGFLPDVRRILKALPARRQNLMFSATMAREIRKLADEVLHKPAVVELANTRPAETIEHQLVPLSETDKPGVLEELLAGDDFDSAIVFTRTKHRAKRLAKKLDARGHAAVALQGNMSQPQRERALKGFKDGTYTVMVATDIAARGLDIEGVSHVINYDVPMTPDAYTHRIGRTGRSERTGSAFTFVTADDGKQVKDIEKRLGAKIERVRFQGIDLPEVDASSLDRERGPRGGQRGGGGGRGTRNSGGGSTRGGGRGGPRGRGRSTAGAGGSDSTGAKPGPKPGPKPGTTRVRPVAAAATAAEPRRSERPSRPFGLGVEGGSARGGGSRGGGRRRR
ncbi:ATP-dependent RNA helicase RhlE [Planctomycetes bacterium Poly30]|uniref:ATP-dependent RNA helicase RhlE n=1 Tax=Saltatorellus ferox TaxID=2528018 RepID=A0A518ESY4_9BACT|nr:ATP-dependent RNA helicase RhlE [Planctomycetes bacterium Poly30]